VDQDPDPGGQMTQKREKFEVSFFEMLDVSFEG
jgi:hypothetical protein